MFPILQSGVWPTHTEMQEERDLENSSINCFDNLRLFLPRYILGFSFCFQFTLNPNNLSSVDKPLPPVRWSCWWAGSVSKDIWHRAVRTLLWLWKAGQARGLGIPAWGGTCSKSWRCWALTEQMGLVLKLPGTESRTKKSFPWQSWTTCPNMLGLRGCFGYCMVWRRKEEVFVYSGWWIDCWQSVFLLQLATFACNISTPASLDFLVFHFALVSQFKFPKSAAVTGFAGNSFLSGFCFSTGGKQLGLL